MILIDDLKFDVVKKMLIVLTSKVWPLYSRKVHNERALWESQIEPPHNFRVLRGGWFVRYVGVPEGFTQLLGFQKTSEHERYETHASI